MRTTHANERGRGPFLLSDWAATLPHRIDSVAHDKQGQIALMDGIGNVLTYADMINRIESIGEALRTAGSGTGSRVLVFQRATSD
ncbi:MAG: hypothetical protein Q9224_004722 [Gallowayella concinna]